MTDPKKKVEDVIEKVTPQPHTADDPHTPGPPPAPPPAPPPPDPHPGLGG